VGSSLSQKRARIPKSEWLNLASDKKSVGDVLESPMSFGVILEKCGVTYPTSVENERANDQDGAISRVAPGLGSTDTATQPPPNV
jgi:hypothetical protein